MKKLISTILALTLVFAMSATAFAADEGSATGEAGFNNNSASTEVKLVAGNDAQGNLSATVPLNVTLAVKSDKSIAAPTNYTVNNTGSIAFHVSGVAATVESPFTFNATAGENTLNLTLAAGTDTVTLSTSAMTINKAQWNVAAGGNLPLTFAGSVGNITADLTTATKVFSVTYTLTAGKAV